MNLKKLKLEDLNKLLKQTNAISFQFYLGGDIEVLRTLHFAGSIPWDFVPSSIVEEDWIEVKRSSVEKEVLRRTRIKKLKELW